MTGRLLGARTIRYDAGNPAAPDDPFGRTLLILDRTGLVRLGNWHRGGERAWSGALDLTVMDEVLDHLAAGGFPDSRPRFIVPGAVFSLEVVADTRLSVMDSVHSENEGYRNALRLLNGVIRQLSGDVLKIGAPPDRALVHSSREIDIGELS